MTENTTHLMYIKTTLFEISAMRNKLYNVNLYIFRTKLHVIAKKYAFTNHVM